MPLAPKVPPLVHPYALILRILSQQTCRELLEVKQFDKTGVLGYGERFRQSVYHHVVYGNVIQLDSSLFDSITEVVVSDRNVLCTLVKFGIFSQGQGSLIIAS
jgi:hypothetical protein